jgi:hypothetical protein
MEGVYLYFLFFIGVKFGICFKQEQRLGLSTNCRLYHLDIRDVFLLLFVLLAIRIKYIL